MATMSATDVKNHIGELWELADREPVTIERNGMPKYQLVSTEKYVVVEVDEYNRLKSNKRVPRRGFAKHLLKGFDMDALLAVDVTSEFEGYL